MKLSTLLAWTCVFAPCASLAQNTPLNVAVQGEIKPAACTLQIDQQATFDYGKVKVKDLNLAKYTLLPAIDRELRISCEAKTTVALTISDTNAGLVPFKDDIVFFGGHGKSWSPDRQYGLRDDTGRAIGSWAAQLVPSFTVDQKPTDSIYSGDNGKTWEPSVGNFFHDDGSLETWSEPGRKEPALGYEFVGTLRVQAVVDQTGRLGVSAEVPFSGGAVLTLVYL